MLSSPRSRSGSLPSTLLARIQLKNISEDNRREGWLPNYSLCLMFDDSSEVFLNMFYQMDEFKKVTEVFFKNKDGRRSYVGLDI